MTPFILSVTCICCLAATYVAALQTGTCRYSQNDDINGDAWCISPTEQVEAPFTFPSLFPNGAKFVYAMDDINGLEVVELDSWLDPHKVSDWQSTMIGWWVEFDKIGAQTN